MSQVLDLWDYRRRVDDIYARVRHDGPGEPTWQQWCQDRDLLFAIHQQSPIDDRETFTGLEYFPYDGRWRTTARFEPIPNESQVIESSGRETGRFATVGTLHFELAGVGATLELLWLDAYGGGVFLPFRDATNGDSTYGGGRYLLDSAKGADLGHEGDHVVLDFNYAYHPSCVHSTRWVCPLAPTANRLSLEITAGERLPGLSRSKTLR